MDIKIPVRDKIDGFRIPTVTMEPGNGNDFALSIVLVWIRMIITLEGQVKLYQ